MTKIDLQGYPRYEDFENIEILKEIVNNTEELNAHVDAKIRLVSEKENEFARDDELSNDESVILSIQQQLQENIINIVDTGSTHVQQSYCVRVFCVLLHELASIAHRDAMHSEDTLTQQDMSSVYINYIKETINKLTPTSTTALYSNKDVMIAMLGEDVCNEVVSFINQSANFIQKQRTPVTSLPSLGPAGAAGGGSKKKPRVPAH